MSESTAIQQVPQTHTIERPASNTFGLANLRDAMAFAERIATSSFIPKAYANKPGDILAAVQMGAELSLPPMQALKSIAVINGSPSLYGDGFLAVIMGHPGFEWIKESDLTEIAKTKQAVCTIKRRGMEPRTVTFTWDMAKTAGLTSKEGPWRTYPDRQMQMRARGFCGRDTFPDALRGILIDAEAYDMPLNEPQTQQVKVEYIQDPAKQIEAAEENNNPTGVDWARAYYKAYTASGYSVEDSKAKIAEIVGVVTDSREVPMKFAEALQAWAMTPKPAVAENMDAEPA